MSEIRRISTTPHPRSADARPLGNPGILRPVQKPSAPEAPRPPRSNERRTTAGRTVASLLFSVLATVGAIKGGQVVYHKTEDGLGWVHDRINGGGEDITLPAKDTEEGKKAILEGVADGELVEVVTDGDHISAFSIAEALTPEGGDIRPLTDAMVDQNGGESSVPPGTSYFVPATERAVQFHDHQFGTRTT